MGRSFGVVLSIVASAVFVVMLLAAFAAESPRDVMLYYGFNTVNPLLAGVFAIGVILTVVAVRIELVTEPVGSGIALGLGLGNVLAVTIWAVTGRVDVFLAPSWAFPAHRWLLVGVSFLIVLGAGLYAWNLGYIPSRLQGR